LILGKRLICWEGIEPPATEEGTRWVVDQAPRPTKLGNEAQKTFDKQGWVIGER
jgi:hypothetical protein